MNFDDIFKDRTFIGNIKYKINNYKKSWNGKLISPLDLGYVKRVGYSTHKDKFSLLELILYVTHYGIEHQFNTKIKHPFYDIKYGIENLIYFFKPIVKFRTFDHGYIIDVIYSVFKKFDEDWKDVGQENEKAIIKSIVKLLGDIRSDNFDYDYSGKQEGQHYKILFNLLENNIRKFWW